MYFEDPRVVEGEEEISNGSQVLLLERCYTSLWDVTMSPKTQESHAQSIEILSLASRVLGIGETMPRVSKLGVSM